jgi:transmembrane sensor
LLLMSDDLDPRILAQWLAGDLDPDDRAVLERWLAADPEHALQLARARELWRRAGDQARTEAREPDPNEAARWAGILGAIRDRPSTLEHPRRRRAADQWGAAAVLLVMAGAGTWVVTHDQAPMRVYETAQGERAEFRLGDGTRVMLNVASQLRVPADYGERSHEVYLQGGAYFEMVHDSASSLEVHAGDMVARDLGTEFTVGAYPEQRHARVVVREGLVSFHAEDSEVATLGATLRPGQQGRLDDRDVPTVQHADTTTEFAWVGGTIIFDRTPLRDALPQLGRWLDLEFRLSDASLGRVQLAATLTNQPADDAVRFLASSLGLRMERQGRVVTIYPGLRR